jgi:KUP system potassium uptake protein
MAYLLSNSSKIPHGGYWSLVVASIPFALILLFTWGQRVLHRRMRPLTMDVFIESYNQVYRELSKIKGTALFFARDTARVPPYIVHTMFRNNIIYEDNVIISVHTVDSPFGVRGAFKTDLAPGLRSFVIEMGYMELVNIENILKKAGIEEKAIFYGLEEITTKNIFWRLFAMVKRMTPPFVQFYDLPLEKLHGVVQRIEM